MGSMVSQITSLTIVYWAFYSGADQRKHQSSAALAFVWGIHRWTVNSPQKWTVTRKMFPFDDVIMMKRVWKPNFHSISVNHCNSKNPLTTPSGQWDSRHSVQIRLSTMGSKVVQQLRDDIQTYDNQSWKIIKKNTCIQTIPFMQTHRS